MRRSFAQGLTMNWKNYKRRLLERERELLADIARLEGEARESRDAEVEDRMDAIVSSESKATSFSEASLEWQALVQVRDALRRMEDGAYGKCIDCGRSIEPERLKAVPWTPYCREDQEKRDALVNQRG